MEHWNDVFLNWKNSVLQIDFTVFPASMKFKRVVHSNITGLIIQIFWEKAIYNSANKKIQKLHLQALKKKCTGRERHVLGLLLLVEGTWKSLDFHM